MAQPTELARLVLNVLVNAQESLPGEGRITVMVRAAERAGQGTTVTITLPKWLPGSAQ